MTTARLMIEESYRGLVPDQEVFADETLRLHRRLTSLRGTRGWQLPWPRALGTPPWAVANELSRLTGRRYRTRWVRRGVAQYLAARDAVSPRVPVAIYIGSAWLPRHVVLAIGTTSGAAGDSLIVYEPSSGQLRTIHPGPWRWHRLGLAGWRRPWFVITPDDARAR